MKGRRVRTRTVLTLPVYDPIHHSDEAFDLAKGVIGLIANPHPTLFDFLLIVFPIKPGIPPTTLEILTRGCDFKVLMVNQPTFKHQFEIEA